MPSKPPTNYDILGVSPDASREEIRRAYRAAARKLHPDASGAPDAEKKFAELSAAYATLSDPMARQAYDKLLRSNSAPKGRRSSSSDPAQPHYTWTNIATGQSPSGNEQSPGRADLDEMYEAFFRRPKKRPEDS